MKGEVKKITKASADLMKQIEKEGKVSPKNTKKLKELKK